MEEKVPERPIRLPGARARAGEGGRRPGSAPLRRRRRGEGGRRGFPRRRRAEEGEAGRGSPRQGGRRSQPEAGSPGGGCTPPRRGSPRPLPPLWAWPWRGPPPLAPASPAGHGGWTEVWSVRDGFKRYYPEEMSRSYKYNTCFFIKHDITKWMSPESVTDKHCVWFLGCYASCSVAGRIFDRLISVITY